MRDDLGTAVSIAGVVSPGLGVAPIGSFTGSQFDRRDRRRCEGAAGAGLAARLGALVAK
jgi:hypothetical protein